MTRTKQILNTIVVGCVMATLPACGGGKTSNDVKQILLSYHSFLDDKKAPPADEKEFASWLAAKQPEASPVFAKLQADGYRVYWGTNPMKLSGGPGIYVLVYPGDATAKGGVVGFGDGSVKVMSAAEFNSASKPPAPKK